MMQCAFLVAHSLLSINRRQLQTDSTHTRLMEAAASARLFDGLIGSVLLWSRTQ